MERRWCAQGSALVREIEQTCPAPGSLALWYLGQCGFAVKGGVSLLIDPVLCDLTGPDGATRRLYPPPFAPTAIKPDYVLCTHGHLDHLQPETVAAIAQSSPETRFILPGGCSAQALALGVAADRLIEARAGEPLELPGVTVTPVRAEHPVAALTPEGAELALCYRLQLNGVSLLHLGDTYLTARLLEDLQTLGSPDLLCLPINGGDYFRTARDCIGNLNPREAATLATLLGAHTVIPTHFDMIMGNTCNPLTFVEELWQQNPAARWRLPALGERLWWQK